MILRIKKADVQDIPKMCITLMSMKESADCITESEMHDFIDRTYYAEDENGNILAIITANRRSIAYSEEATRQNLNSTRYQIKHLLFSKQAIEEAGYDCTKVVTRLVKELCADLNDWSVWIDVEYQAEINLGASKEDTISIITESILANGFKQAINRFAYIRVMPIDFGKLH